MSGSWAGWLLLLGLALIGFVAWRDAQSQRTLPLSTLYYSMVVYNLLQCLAQLAVQQEFAQVRAERPTRAHLPAMLRLPSGHQLQGETLNFPALELLVQVRPGVPLRSGDELHLSLFRGAFEFSTAVQVVSVQTATPEGAVAEPGRVACLRVAQSAEADYLALGRAVYSRDADWPAWLPEEQADRILPLWMHRLGQWGMDVFYNLVIGSPVHKRWEQFVSWILSGIKKNGST